MPASVRAAGRRTATRADQDGRARERPGSSVRSQHHVRLAVGSASAVVADPDTCSTPAGGWWLATGVVRAGYSGLSLRARVRFSRAVRVGAFGSWVAWVVDGSGRAVGSPSPGGLARVRAHVREEIRGGSGRGACSVGSGGPCPHAHEEPVGAVVRRPRARHASDAPVPGVPDPRAHGWPPRPLVMVHAGLHRSASARVAGSRAGGLGTVEVVVPAVRWGAAGSAAPPGRWAGSSCSRPRAPTGGVLNTCSVPLPRRSRAGLA